VGPLLLAGAAATARRHPLALVLVPLAAVGLVVVVVLSFVLALGSGSFACVGDAGSGAAMGGPPPSRAAVAEILPARLRLYRQAGRAYDIDWAFLAAVAYQECRHGPEVCAGDNGSGCAGPMQISMRRGSPCSPGAGPTLWELYGVDADHDGDKDVNDPVDAIPTAARILRRAKGAPPAGGSYAEMFALQAARFAGAAPKGGPDA